MIVVDSQTCVSPSAAKHCRLTKALAHSSTAVAKARKGSFPIVPSRSRF